MAGRQQFRYYYECGHHTTGVVDPSAADIAYLVTTMMGLCPRCRWASEHPDSGTPSNHSTPCSSGQLTSDDEQVVSTLVINEGANRSLLASPAQPPPIIPPAPSVQQQQQQQEPDRQPNLDASENHPCSSGHVVRAASPLSSESWVHVPTPGGSSTGTGPGACIANDGDKDLDRIREWRTSQSQTVGEKGDYGASPITVSSSSPRNSDSDTSVRFLKARRRARARAPFEPTVKVLEVRKRQQTSTPRLSSNSCSHQGVESVKVCQGHHAKRVIVPTSDSTIEVIIHPRNDYRRRRDGEQAWNEVDGHSRRATISRNGNRIVKNRPRGLEASLAETGSATSSPGRLSPARRPSSPVRNAEEATAEDERYQEKLVQYLHGLILEFEPAVYANTGIDPESLSVEQHHRFLSMKLREYAAEVHERRYRSALIKRSSSSSDIQVKDEA